MNKLLYFLKGIRFINLLMLVFAQAILSFTFVKKFSFLHLTLISSATLLIALAGYLLNDVQDFEIDLKNQKLKLVNEANHKSFSLLAYALFVLSLIPAALASYNSEAIYFGVFIFAIAMLIFYAHFLSKYKFIGNLQISALIALAILLCFYMELAHPSFTRKFYAFDVLNIWIYAALAFMFSWFREMVKDIEDRDGDELAGRWTMVLLLGLNKIKWLLASFFSAFFVFFSFLIIKNSNHLGAFFFYLLALDFTLLFLMIRLIPAKEKKDFATLSSLLKILMLLGILFPLFSKFA